MSPYPPHDLPAKAKAGPRVRADANLFTTLRDLWPYIWPADRPDLKRRIYGALVMLLIAKLITILVPYAFKWATDAVNGGSHHEVPLLPQLMTGAIALTIGYGALRIVTALITQARDALFASVAMHAVRRLATDVFVHLHGLSLRYHLERKTGGLTRVLERGRSAIETIVRMAMLTGVPTIVEFVMVLAVFLFQFNWLYAAAVTAMIVVYMAFTTIATNWRISIRRSMNDSDQDANTKAIDSLLNFETVKYFGAEQREAARYDQSMARYEKLSIRTYTSLAVLNAGQAVIFSVGLAMVMLLCVQGIRAGRNTVGDFVLVNAIMIQLYQPLSFMGLVYREVKQAIIDIELMFAILDQHPEIRDRPGAPDLVVTEGRVRFEDVHFAYDAARPILRGVSFEIAPGATVAVVGPSGAGKSTLSRLMFRFYEAAKGRITIDGQDVREVTQHSLRAAIGMVPQDTVLFNDSVEYNIRYGRWEAGDGEVRQAAVNAQIDAFIAAVPGGYQAQVGERGLKLSGGEKQRVAIARTMLKGPPVLVLDEATSALDSFTEREIQDALERVSRGRTTLVIAHRLSTVVNADEILVLVKGLIVERGTHAALLERGGVYAAMWNRQRQADAALTALRRSREEAERALAEGGSPAVTSRPIGATTTVV